MRRSHGVKHAVSLGGRSRGPNPARTRVSPATSAAEQASADVPGHPRVQYGAFRSDDRSSAASHPLAAPAKMSRASARRNDFEHGYRAWDAPRGRAVISAPPIRPAEDSRKESGLRERVSHSG